MSSIVKYIVLLLWIIVKKLTVAKKLGLAFLILLILMTILEANQHPKTLLKQAQMMAGGRSFND
jgi:hypothetical protein